MLSPADLRLPFQEWRTGQLDLLTRLATSEAKYILLEAPTGSGKSALALSLRRLMGSRSVILSGTKALQDQYVETFGNSGLVQAKGRGNFQCHIAPVSAAEAPCVYGEKCPRANLPTCDYYDQKITAQLSDEAVLNYQYWLAQANYTKQFTGVELLICDEAHEIEHELRRFVTETVRYNALNQAGIPLPPSFQEFAEWQAWAAQVMPRARAAWGAAEKKSRLEKTLSRLYDTLGAVRFQLDDEHWTFVITRDGIEFRPVWVAKAAQDYLLKHAERILFMSATILDQQMFCENLGLPLDQVEFIRVGSTFPKERRPLIYDPVGKVKSINERSLRALLEKINGILAAHPGRGLVHTSNYQIAEYLAKYARDRHRLITHTTATRGRALQQLRASPGAVLVSPSVTTGVDLPYDLCEFQVIAKIPFPDLGDPQTKKRMKLGPDGKPRKAAQSWYNWTTACRIVQAYGRGMRAPDDNCVTYLLDGNWGWFRPAVKHMLPEWFTEAIQWPAREGSPGISIQDQIKNAISAKIPA